MIENSLDLVWLCRPFSELTTCQLYDVFKLRQAVFILEQKCLYPDIDQKDQQCHHLLGYRQTELVAYLRIIPAGLSYHEPSIGRVVVAQSARQSGCGRILMVEGIKELQSIYPGKSIKIGAQYYLKTFYSSLGFIECGEVYDEDGILHIDMQLNNPIVDKYDD